MVRWLLTLALCSWLSGALAFSVTPGSKIDRQLLPFRDTGLISVKSRRALLATQATGPSGVEEAENHSDDQNSGNADDCNLQQDNLDLCVFTGAVGCWDYKCRLLPRLLPAGVST